MNRPVLSPSARALPLRHWRVWGVPTLCLLAALAIATPERNSQLFQAINGWAARGPEFIWEWLTALGDTLTAFCILLMLSWRRADIVVAAMIAAVLATLSTHLAKDLLDIPRPPLLLSDSAHVIGEVLHRGAFPSGHTATAFTLIAVLAAYVRSASALVGLLLLAVAIGLSRIAVGVHWPLDVVGGALMGWISGIAGVQCLQFLKWQRRPLLLAGIRALLLLSACLLLLSHGNGYPQADWLLKSIALLALAWFLRETLLARHSTGTGSENA